MSHHDTLTLREALRSIQYEAASLADAQVIALQALNATYPARAALSAGDAVDAQRLDFIEEHCRCDPKMDGQHVWWPTSFNTAQLLKGPTLREALDNAIRARKDNT